MDIREKFAKWEESVRPEIARVDAILGKRVNKDEPEETLEAMTEIETFNGRVHNLLSWAEYYLDEAKRYYTPQSEGRALDREAFLDGELAPFRFVRNKLEGQAESIKQRIIMCESITSYRKQPSERKF